MLVILAILAYHIGQIASLAALAVAVIITASARHPVALVPLCIAGLWIAGTVDFLDMTDGPMRIDAEANLLGTGGGVPPWLSNGADGPVWWIPTAAAVCFAAFIFAPKLPNLRPTALIGLALLAVTYGGLAALDAMY